MIFDTGVTKGARMGNELGQLVNTQVNMNDKDGWAVGHHYGRCRLWNENT